jgi:hypothetical protein
MLSKDIRLALRTRFSGKNVFNVFDTCLCLDQNLGVGITTIGIAALGPSRCHCEHTSTQTKSDHVHHL